MSRQQNLNEDGFKIQRRYTFKQYRFLKYVHWKHDSEMQKKFQKFIDDNYVPNNQLEQYDIKTIHNKPPSTKKQKNIASRLDALAERIQE